MERWSRCSRRDVVVRISAHGLGRSILMFAAGSRGLLQLVFCPYLAQVAQALLAHYHHSQILKCYLPYKRNIPEAPKRTLSHTSKVSGCTLTQRWSMTRLSEAGLCSQFDVAGFVEGIMHWRLQVADRRGMAKRRTAATTQDIDDENSNLSRGSSS